MPALNGLTTRPGCHSGRTDLYTTLAAAVGATVPADRPIDGVDQSEFFWGGAAKSAREGFVYYIRDELRAVKWRDWKMHLVWESEPNEGTRHLETPWIFNLIADPKEESNVATEASWVRGPMRRMVDAFSQSLREFPAIPPGAADQFAPLADGMDGSGAATIESSVYVLRVFTQAQPIATVRLLLSARPSKCPTDNRGGQAINPSVQAQHEGIHGIALWMLGMVSNDPAAFIRGQSADRGGNDRNVRRDNTIVFEVGTIRAPKHNVAAPYPGPNEVLA
jgi:hypothetical protein